MAVAAAGSAAATSRVEAMAGDVSAALSTASSGAAATATTARGARVHTGAPIQSTATRIVPRPYRRIRYGYGPRYYGYGGYRPARGIYIRF